MAGAWTRGPPTTTTRRSRGPAPVRGPAAAVPREASRSPGTPGPTPTRSRTSTGPSPSITSGAPRPTPTPARSRRRRRRPRRAPRRPAGLLDPVFVPPVAATRTTTGSRPFRRCLQTRSGVFSLGRLICITTSVSH